MASVAYKGFNQDWTCRGFAYEIGKTYTHDSDVVACKSGFHACENPLDVWTYYSPATSRYAIVEIGGMVARHDKDSKIASAEITVKAEILLPDMIRRAVAWIVAAAKENLASKVYGHAAATGDYGHAAATGNSGHAAATGHAGHAAATGDWGHAAVKGKNTIAAALGIRATARAESGGAIMLAAYDDNYGLVAVRASLVGENGVAPGKMYRLTKAGEFEEVEVTA